MKRMVIGLALAALTLAAQDVKKENPPGPREQKLFILKYVDPTQLASLLSVFNASVRQNSEMHALAVETTPESMRAIEDAISKLDVPSAAPKNVELTMYLLIAGDSATPGGSAVPKELDAVTGELKNTFPFKSYSLLDVLTFRARTGQRISNTSSGGSFPMGGSQVASTTNVRINSISLASDGSTVRIDQLNFSEKVPVSSGGNNWNFQDLGIQTDLDIKAGQKVVVGRLGISHDQAMFLVMVAKIL